MSNETSEEEPAKVCEKEGCQGKGLMDHIDENKNLIGIMAIALICVIWISYPSKSCEESVIIENNNEEVVSKLEQVSTSIDLGFEAMNKRLEQSLKTREFKDDMFTRRMERFADKTLVDMEDVNHSCDLQFKRDMSAIKESATHINNAQQTVLKMALYMTCASVATSSLVILSYICMSAIHSNS